MAAQTLTAAETIGTYVMEAIAEAGETARLDMVEVSGGSPNDE